MWVIGLGIAAGYLINKNLSMSQQLENAVYESESNIKPATDGVTSQEVRQSYKRLDNVKYGDMNDAIPFTEKARLLSLQKKASSAVESFDSQSEGCQPIQGVVMHFGV
eukprot:6174295-Pleurochrysis_carterae.AAC.3